MKNSKIKVKNRKDADMQDDFGEQVQSVGLEQQVEELQQQLSQKAEELQIAKAKELRAVADYKNLVRRQQEERGKIARLAAQDFVENILESLVHLSLAAEQINDTGLNMVIGQLWMKLNDAGLEEINPVGQPFNETEMEVVTADQEVAQDMANTAPQVKKVVSKGYRLNGEVIRHAKVAV